MEFEEGDVGPLFLQYQSSFFFFCQVHLFMYLLVDAE